MRTVSNWGPIGRPDIVVARGPIEGGGPGEMMGSRWPSLDSAVRFEIACGEAIVAPL